MVFVFPYKFNLQGRRHRILKFGTKKYLKALKRDIIDLKEGRKQYKNGRKKPWKALKTNEVWSLSSENKTLMTQRYGTP